MRVRILPYKQGSRSARELSRMLGARRVRLVRTRFVPRRGDFIINWGNCSRPDGAAWSRAFILNRPEAVAIARNKLLTLSNLEAGHVPSVEWTTDRERAQGWLDTGDAVYGRHSLTGQGGSGIEYMNPGFTAAQCPLYTKHFNAVHEWRIHAWAQRPGYPIFAQKKRRRNGADPAPVRNHANGYVYCTDGVEAPEVVINVAKRAVCALGLDFGAVDIQSKENGDVAVLEVNTAPGLEGRTLYYYTECLTGEVGP